MAVEFVGAAVAGLRAHSVALMAFGADSGIEMLSAAVVLRRFGSRLHVAEATASRMNAWLLVALAVYIVADSGYVLFATGVKPEPSYFGMAVLIASAVAMPWFARRKRTLADATHSSSLRADAAQSSVCAYLAWIALAGLALNAVAGVAWADPLAALALLPLVIKEARDAYAGKACCD
jgi:divalent metal cation (Fe/Co/Zn/Cd) transporter